ncbi:hypothetical protein Maes01_01688 [Microbulbifer aestuariivivens]|uniref:Uncharacterized protein n=1 Tax=Microbulbifer aestuariivivens TaxID=1908308 RepID=A0ABP9WSA1_9GAMM
MPTPMVLAPHQLQGLQVAGLTPRYRDYSPEDFSASVSAASTSAADGPSA